MNYTGQELVDLKIVTGTIEEENIQQHGVDLNLIEVRRIKGYGFVPNKANKGKTILADRSIVPLKNLTISGFEVLGWELEPGNYDITLLQGCQLPPNVRMKIVHRSSMFRNAAEINSALFDAGFGTKNIGTIMRVEEPLIIEYEARVAQMTATMSNVVQKLYNGQWQNDQQRANGGKITGLCMHENDPIDYARK